MDHPEGAGSQRGVMRDPKGRQTQRLPRPATEALEPSAGALR